MMRFPRLYPAGKQRASIGDRSSPNRATVKDGGVTEETHVEETTQSELRAPEPTMDGPTRSRKRFGRPPASHLDHGNLVSLLRQSERRNTASEAGADDDEIEIKLMIARFHTASLAARDVTRLVPWFVDYEVLSIRRHIHDAAHFIFLAKSSPLHSPDFPRRMQCVSSQQIVRCESMNSLV